jgi:hypothetical protein
MREIFDDAVPPGGCMCAEPLSMRALVWLWAAVWCAGAARKAVERALAETVHEPSEELRRLQLDHLDELSRRAWVVLTPSTRSSPTDAPSNTPTPLRHSATPAR